MLGRIKLVRTKEDEVVSSPAMIVVSVAMFIGAYQLRPYLGERLPDPEGRLSELAQRLYFGLRIRSSPVCVGDPGGVSRRPT
jgi:hypothetical protein